MEIRPVSYGQGDLRLHTSFPFLTRFTAGFKSSTRVNVIVKTTLNNGGKSTDISVLLPSSLLVVVCCLYIFDVCGQSRQSFSVVCFVRTMTTASTAYCAAEINLTLKGGHKQLWGKIKVYL